MTNWANFTSSQIICTHMHRDNDTCTHTRTHTRTHTHTHTHRDTHTPIFLSKNVLWACETGGHAQVQCPNAKCSKGVINLKMSRAAQKSSQNHFSCTDFGLSKKFKLLHVQKACTPLLVRTPRFRENYQIGKRQNQWRKELLKIFGPEFIR